MNNATTKTLYISDLDGTLLNQSAELSEFTVKSINSMIAGGLNFSVATARTLEASEVILAELDLKLPLILLNGVLIYGTAENEYRLINKLQPGAVREIISTLKASEMTAYMFEHNNGTLKMYHEPLLCKEPEHAPLIDFMKDRIARYDYKCFRQTESLCHVPPEHIIYFMSIGKRDRLLPVYDALSKLPDMNMVMYKDNYSPDLWFMELYSADASKQNAVEYLRKIYKYDKIVGFGDNINDLPMFEACDTTVAVENARPEVKAAADFICSANTEDGVAKWLHQNVVY